MKIETFNTFLCIELRIKSENLRKLNGFSKTIKVKSQSQSYTITTPNETLLNIDCLLPISNKLQIH